MSRKPEATFRAKVKKKLDKRIRSWGINDSYAQGVPDCRYRGCKTSLWVEYKYYLSLPRVLNLCSTSVQKPPLTRLQQNWLRVEYELGTNVCVVVGCPEGAIVLLNFDWEKAIPIDELQILPVNRWVEIIADFCGVKDGNI